MKPGPLLAVAVGAFAVSWLWLRRHPALGFGQRALQRLLWNADGSWLVEDAEGRKSEAQLLGSTYVHPRLMVLNFKLNIGSRRTRLILGDEAEPELLRRLRARLLNQGPAAAV
jgi:toxin CptA